MKKRENLSATIPIGMGKVIKDMAESRRLSKSKLIEMVFCGIIQIDPLEYKQWSMYHEIIEKEEEDEKKDEEKKGQESIREHSK